MSVMVDCNSDSIAMLNLLIYYTRSAIHLRNGMAFAPTDAKPGTATAHGVAAYSAELPCLQWNSPSVEVGARSDQELTNPDFSVTSESVDHDPCGQDFTPNGRRFLGWKFTKAGGYCACRA